jgi:hypothetical protein
VLVGRFTGCPHDLRSWRVNSGMDREVSFPQTYIPREQAQSGLTDMRQLEATIDVSNRLNSGRAASTIIRAAASRTVENSARKICGNLSCTSMHFQALGCNGRLLIMPGSRVRFPPFPPILSMT